MGLSAGWEQDGKRPGLDRFSLCIVVRVQLGSRGGLFLFFFSPYEMGTKSSLEGKAGKRNLGCSCRPALQRVLEKPFLSPWAGASLTLPRSIHPRLDRRLLLAGESQLLGEGLAWAALCSVPRVCLQRLRKGTQMSRSWGTDKHTGAHCVKLHLFYAEWEKPAAKGSIARGSVVPFTGQPGEGKTAPFGTRGRGCPDGWGRNRL